MEFTELKDEVVGGILVTAQQQEDKLVATVISVGCTQDKVVPGDKIVLTKFAGVKVKINSSECLIVNDEDILAKIV